MGDEQLPIVLFKKADEPDAKWDNLCSRTITLTELATEQPQNGWPNKTSQTLDYEITTQDWQQVKRLFKMHIPRKLKKRIKKRLVDLYIAMGVKQKKVTATINEIINLQVKIKQKYRHETHRKH